MCFPNSEAGQLLWQVLLLSVNVPDASGLAKRFIFFLVGDQWGSGSPNVIWI